MKKLQVRDMKVGGIYNVVYVGQNHEYGRINGKYTIRVVETIPKFKFYQIFYQFGWIDSDELRSPMHTAEDVERCFRDEEIYEPENESQWFKHSLKFKGLAEALKRGVLTLDAIRDCPVNSRVNSSGSPFVSVASPDCKSSWLYASFNVEDKTAEPLLQRVYIRWDTWEKMRADFRQYGVHMKI